MALDSFSQRCVAGSLLAVVGGWLISTSVQAATPQRSPRMPPVAATLPAEAAEARGLPRPLSAGGGPMSLSGALKWSGSQVAQDREGRPWMPLGVAEFASPAKLGDSQWFFVLRPDPVPAEQGLLGGSRRNWDDFLAFRRLPEGHLLFRYETATGRWGTVRLAAEAAPVPGDPMLVVIRPQPEARCDVIVNGTPVGTIPADINGNVFGVGYATESGFRGGVGEIRRYPGLLPEQVAAVSKILTSWWGLPGGVAHAYPPGYRDAPGILDGTVTLSKSAALTLRRRTPAATSVFLGASPAAPPVVDDLPGDATALLGRRWRLQLNTPEPLHFSFGLDETGLKDFFGEQGFAGLLFRKTTEEPWQECSATSPTADGWLHFPNVRSETGEFALAVIQGRNVSQSRACLTIDGKPVDGGCTLEPGTPVRLSVTGAAPDEHLELIDRETGVGWYRGPATALDLVHLPLRTGATTLTASFSGDSSVLPVTRPLVLTLDSDEPTLYPGLLGEVIRRDGTDPALPGPQAFAPEITPPPHWPSGYPPFRTAEATLAPSRDPGTGPAWKPPSFFHSIVPSLAITPDPKQVVSLGALFRYPVGDLGAVLAAARFSGRLLIAQPGSYAFRLECNLPARLEIGGSVITVPGSDSLAAVSLPVTATPLTLTVMNTTEARQLTCRLLWKPPGAVDFTAVPAGSFVHPVDAVRGKALADLTNSFAHRQARVSPRDDDSAAVRLLKDFVPEALVADASRYDTAVRELAGAFLYGQALAGDPRAARAACDLIVAFANHLRSHPEQLVSGGWARTNGSLMRLHEWLRPFLSVCENHPNLQAASLAARAELANYAVSTCLSRPFLTEQHFGTNDGYGDENNLLVNFWRAAAALDDPYAYDAATCLMDSHFRYAAGRNEGLCSDGIFAFHNANGRHVHMGGYGVDWFRRVAHGNRLGSPWGYTQEEYHRLTEFVLAYEWFFYRDTALFTANGRHNTHAGSTRHLVEMSDRLTRLPKAAVAAGDREALAAMRSRIAEHPDNSIWGHRFFFRHLLTVHRREDFQIDVKMTSPLVGPVESFAGAFPWNMSFGDGVTTLMRHGREYVGIHRNAPNAAYSHIRGWKEDVYTPADLSLWRYRSLPGVCQLDDEMHAPDRYRGGGGSAAGGVSDGTLGHGGFHFISQGTGANVCRFFAFTDDGMLVLNTGITNTRSGAIPENVRMRSNVNQCDWLSDVTLIAQNNRRRVIRHSSEGDNLSIPLNQRIWVEQDGIGYLVLPTGDEGGKGHAGALDLRLATSTPLDKVPGFDIPEKTATAIREKGLHEKRRVKTFHLSINHGTTVTDAQAAYFVCMRGADADAASWLQEPPLDILANQPALQAVRDCRDDTVHAFFREPGELRDTEGRLLLAVTTPASVMWRPATAALTVQDPVAACVTDATKMVNTLTVTLGPALVGITRDIPVSVVMPGSNDSDDRYRGRPVTIAVAAAQTEP